MKMSDLNNLNLENIGSWPAPVKIAGAILVATLIIGIGWWQDIDPLQQKLAGEQKKEGDLKIAFEGKQKKAANLPALKQQLEDIKETFGDLLKRLPNKTEVAELLVDISQQGLGAGPRIRPVQTGQRAAGRFLRRVADRNPCHWHLSPVRHVHQWHLRSAAHRHESRHQDHADHRWPAHFADDGENLSLH